MLGGGHSKNKKVDDMLNFGSGKTNIKVDSMLGLKGKTKGNKVDMMLGTNTKGKSFKMDDWMSTGHNNNVSNVLGSFAMKPMSPLGVEKRARRQTMKNPVGVGVRRLKQQRGLSPMGDFDGDKLVNALDCNPRNAKEQGWIHSAYQAVKGAKYNPETEDEELPPMGTVTTELPIDMTVERTSGGDPGVMIKTPNREHSIIWGGKAVPPEKDPLFHPMPTKPSPYKIEDFVPQNPQGAQEPGPVKRLVKDLGVGSGLWMDPKVRAERNALRDKQKFELDKIRVQTEAKVFAAQEARAKKGAYGYLGRTGRQTAKALTQAPAAFGGGFSGVGQTVTPQSGAERMSYMLGLTGNQGGAYQAVASSGTPYNVKVDELVGSGELARQYQEQSAVQQPMQQQPQQPMPVQQPQRAPQQRTQSDSNRVWSPFSRRYVTYTRGPYKR